MCPPTFFSASYDQVFAPGCCQFFIPFKTDGAGWAGLQALRTKKAFAHIQSQSIGVIYSAARTHIHTGAATLSTPVLIKPWKTPEQLRQ
jgi:hypothetical protein